MSSVSILVPGLPESVADATVATWYKKPDDAVVRNEVLVKIEVDKVVLEVLASTDGIPGAVLGDEGITVTSCQILGRLCEGNSAGKETSAKSEEKVLTPAQRQQVSLEEQNNNALSPVIRCLLAEHNLDANATRGTSMGGRLAREDVERHLTKAPVKESTPAVSAPIAQPTLVACSGKRVPVTCLRRRVAECPPGTKNSTAMPTTLDKVNMKPTTDLRKQHGEVFKKRHGIRLGSMSLYVRAVIGTLKRYPGVNAPIDGDDVIYHNYFDISMAVSMPCSLVTPVLRNIDTLGTVDVEKEIKEPAVKGRDDELTAEDLTGGNSTVTDGGIFGSLMSAPITNPPQSVILGMHTVKDRPMVVNGQVEILPMMHLASSYDRRLIDGRESADFLVTIKELPEDPMRLPLDAQQFKLHLHCRPTQIGCRSTV